MDEVTEGVDTSIYQQQVKPADPLAQIANMEKTQQALRLLGAGQPYGQMQGGNDANG
jgi:hypothetical protein